MTEVEREVEEEVEEVEGEGETEGKENGTEGGGKTADSRKSLTPGVVYLSRIPPFMRPRKVRHLLSQYGTIGRVYLQPEDSHVRQRRQKFKKNRKRNYTEGWVEFTDKRVAKATAMILNNTQIGGKKRYYYHDDIWNMKYLPKFCWTHLTEKIAYEQAVRDQRLRLELSQVRRQNNHFLENVERSKQVTAIVDRKKKRGEELLEHTMRRFRQRRVADRPVQPSPSPSSTEPHPSGLKDSLLMKILPGHQ